MCAVPRDGFAIYASAAAAAARREQLVDDNWRVTRPWGGWVAVLQTAGPELGIARFQHLANGSGQQGEEALAASRIHAG